jgi:hypothetical protein
MVTNSTANFDSLIEQAHLIMNKRVIRVCIEKEPELYKELESAMVEHREYDGCYIMQYSEYRNSEYQLIGEYLLCEAGTDKTPS